MNIFLLYPSLLLCDDAYGHYIPVLYSDLVNYATFFEKKNWIKKNFKKNAKFE